MRPAEAPCPLLHLRPSPAWEGLVPGSPGAEPSACPCGELGREGAALLRLLVAGL